MALTADAAELEDGLAAVRRGDTATAARLWSPLAARGDAEAQYSVATLYQNGIGVEADGAKAMRRVADFSPQLVTALGDLALRYNINIIGGSLPVLDGDTLYNEAYLFKRNGDIGRQRKLHITPVERRLTAR